MKPAIGKLLFAALLSVLAVNTSFADWQCYASDKGGHTWASGGSTQERATQVAMNFCAAYSPNSGSCHPNHCAMN